jgi:hypothetical protein
MGLAYIWPIYGGLAGVQGSWLQGPRPLDRRPPDVAIAALIRYSAWRWLFCDTAYVYRARAHMAHMQLLRSCVRRRYVKLKAGRGRER